MPYESSIDKNGSINENLKQIVKDCFSDIFEMLGEKKFRRWVHTRKLSEDVKNIIIDYMSQKEEEERPNWDGFTNSQNNTIKVHEKRGQLRTKGITTHEIYHIITRHFEGFGIYIDEGMTEYLKGMSTEEGSNSYMENVRMVKFLHQMLGDSIVKAYLMGKVDDFDKSFADKIGLDSIDEIKKFYDILDKRHKLLHPATEDEINDHNANKENIEQELNTSKLDVKNMIRKIIIGKASKMAQDLEFYQNGNFGYDGCLGIIKKWIKQIPTDFGFNLQEQAELEHDALGEVFEYSHLLVGLEGEIKEQKKEELMSKVFPIQRDENGHVKQIPTSYSKIKGFDKETQDLASKIFQKTFENCSDISLIDFIDKTLNIASHINPSKRQLHALISEYAIKMFGEKVDITLINSLVKENLARYKILFDIEKERKADTVESSYRKLDDTSYIEKRDNQYFYVKVLEDGTQVEAKIGFVSGSYYNPELKQDIRIEMCSSHEEIVHKILEQEEQEKQPIKVYRIRDNGREKIISLTDKIDSLKVHGMQDYYRTLGVLDSKEFRKMETISPLVKQIQKKIDSLEYIEILNDAEMPPKIEGVVYTADIDERSRKIYFAKLIQDLLKIEQLLPEDKMGKLLQEQLIEKALDRTFGMKKEKQENGEFKRDDKAQKAYDDVTKQILSGKIEENEIEDAINILNELRKERIKENKKHSLVLCLTEEASKKYDIYIKSKERRHVRKQEFNLRREIETGKIPYTRYYKGDGKIGDFSDVAFGLKDGVYVFGPETEDKSRTFLVDKLCEDLISKVGNVRSNNMYKLVREYLEQVLNKVYKTGEIKRNDEQMQEHYSIIIEDILQNVMNGKEIDKEQLYGSLSYLNDNRTKRVIEESKKFGGGIYITNTNTMAIYTTLCDLSKLLPAEYFEVVKKRLVEEANRGHEEVTGTKEGVNRDE